MQIDYVLKCRCGRYVYSLHEGARHQEECDQGFEIVEET